MSTTGKNLSYKAECPTGWSDWNATLEIVAAAGKNIGINIETYFPEAANFSTDYSTGNFEITISPVLVHQLPTRT